MSMEESPGWGSEVGELLDQARRDTDAIERAVWERARAQVRRDGAFARLHLDHGFSYTRIAGEFGLSATGVRFAIARTGRNGVVELDESGVAETGVSGG